VVIESLLEKPTRAMHAYARGDVSDAEQVRGLSDGQAVDRYEFHETPIIVRQSINGLVELPCLRFGVDALNELCDVVVVDEGPTRDPVCCSLLSASPTPFGRYDIARHAVQPLRCITPAGLERVRRLDGR
jgi:hypothetical protein